VQPILVKVTVHSALHIATMERSECNARPGMMLAARVPGGNKVMLSVHVCTNCTCSPLGRQATMGTGLGRIFAARASVVRKWLVAPELRMAHHLIVLALVLIVLVRIKVASAYF
jgi:hypothetical protein